MNGDKKQKYIARIGELQDDLEKLGVKRERFNFARMSFEEIEDLGKSIAEQLKARRKHLGVKENNQ